MKKTKTVQPTYWQNLSDLNPGAASDGSTDEFSQPLENQEMDGTTRRHFMGVMGASMAMAGMSAGCIRRPIEKIIFY
jgi:MoCo/4Fe-4S cofactor protein with predicted Tat translocation signal